MCVVWGSPYNNNVGIGIHLVEELKCFWTVNEWQVCRHETQTPQLQLHYQQSLIPTQKFNIPNINGNNTLTQDDMGLLPVITATVTVSKCQ